MKRITLLLLLLYTFCTGMMAQNVVRVAIGGDTEDYASIHEAVDAANSAAETVMTLLDDVIIDDPIVVKSKMTLDLNGRMLGSEGGYIIRVNGTKADLTIRDGSGTGEGSVWQETEISGHCIQIINDATLTLESGTIHSSISGQQNYGGGITVNSGGTLNITGGCIEADGYQSIRGITMNEGRVNMYGGKISSACEDTHTFGIYAFNAKSDIRVMGGEIYANARVRTCYGINIEKGYASISGGTISSDCQFMGSSIMVDKENATITINGGRFMSKTQRGALTDITTHAPKDNITINGGVFSKEMNIEPYLKDRYIAALREEDEDYNKGYRFTVTDKPYTTDIARNLTRNKGYSTLETALQEAATGDTVALTNNYTLRNDVTVKDGTTLLIPFDINNTCYTSQPLSAYPHLEEYVHRILTVADGVRIDVEGRMSVAATLSSVAAEQYHGTGAPYGAYALVTLGSNSEINVSGDMYCWGYVNGKGKVNVNSGATLYEAFQITDWRGGTVSSEIEEKSFPFNQYYVQNVEVPVTFHYGARNMTATDISFQNESHSVYDMPYITPDTAGMYRMHAASTITRTYNAITDRVTYDIEGNTSLGNVIMYYSGIKMDSRYYTFFIGNNVTLNINSGTLSIPNDYAMLAGARMNIAANAAVDIKANNTLYVYDKKDWGLFAAKGYVLPLEHTATNSHGNRAVRWGSVTEGTDAASLAKVTSACINVDGALKLHGRLMITTGGAEINTTGDGAIVFCNGTKEEQGSIFMSKGMTTELVEIPVISLPMDKGILLGDVNGDGSVTMSDANAIVNKYLGAPVSNFKTLAADMDEDGSITMSDANQIVNAYLK